MISSLAPLDWLQTLADPTRVRLLRLLDREELSVTELCTVLQLPQSTVSRHLKLLVGEEWLASRRDGNNHLYRVELTSWSDARSDLWSWVRQQASDVTTTQLDDRRLEQVLAERPRSDDFFRSAAAQWDAMRVELFGPRVDACALAATLSPSAVVGELGCGSAPLAQLVAPFVRQVIAVDNSPAMLAAAEQQLKGLHNVALQLASLDRLPIADGQLDAAWLVLVLPYFVEGAGILREAARVLKPGAPLIIVDMSPHDRQLYRQEMGHVRLGLSRDLLQGWCDESGMSIERFWKLPPDSAARGPELFTAVLKHKQEMPSAAVDERVTDQPAGVSSRFEHAGVCLGHDATGG
ncbi:MAG: metalloregulator ArsR/SmtB family transcription factor [Pirellulaceae bacterium]|nr:metalloregulator ArsR/SmtB family transcription factor [Pirellulaceae bacterium]